MSQWYPHYVGDYLRDTAHLSMQEDGAYRRLLDHCYSTARPLPASKEALYRITRAFTEAERAAVDSVVLGFFDLRGDGYHNARADRELEKRAQLKSSLSDRGQRGAHERWRKKPGNESRDGHGHASANGRANGQTMAYPQPQPQPKEEKSICAPAVRARPDYPGFERFYQAYPRKVDRKRALAAWAKIEFIEQHVETVLVGLAKWVSCEQWQDEQFIPHPATFLNNRRWEAEPPKKGVGNGKPAIDPNQRSEANLRELGLLN